MNDLAYSGINTTVRILEQQLLSKDIMNSLLASKDLQQALEVLQKRLMIFKRMNYYKRNNLMRY